MADARHRAPEVAIRGAEAQAVQQRDRPRAHGDDVAEDAADPCGRSLERLDGRGMVVALDLERDRLAVAEVDTPAFSPGPWSTRSPEEGSRRKQRRRMLVPAVLGPEEREDGELEAVRVALEQPADTLQLPVGEAEGAVQRLFRDCRQSYFSLEPEPAGRG